MRRFFLTLAGGSWLAGLLLFPAGSPADAPKAEHKTYTDSVPGESVKFEMVAIPGGSFTMGSPDGEAGRTAAEGPQHQVTVKPFWMGKYEVTWDEYDLFWKSMVAAPAPGKKPEGVDAITRPTPPFADETFGHGREKHPVIAVTHHAAMEYCRWLSLKTGKTYRLPTEAEWEYACRAGTKTAYSYGDDASKIGDYAWFKDNSEELTHEVGQKKSNPWGLYDMHGNVAEFCLCHFAADDYAKRPEGALSFHPDRLPKDKRFSHVIRGGSWIDEAPKLRSAYRVGSDRTWLKRDPQRPQSIWWLTDAEFVGFRIVRAVEEDPLIKKHLEVKVTRQSPYE